MRRLFKKVGNFFRLGKNKWRDRKTHIYKECTHCHAVLRLPKQIGTHEVVCPRCHERFEVFVK